MVSISLLTFVLIANFLVLSVNITNGTVILDLGKLEGIMTERDQIPTEKYELNQKIRGYVADVRRDTRGKKESMQVSVSRTNPDFVRKLFEFEIPEIYEGLIEIKSIYRDPGSRSKVAVYSQDENIDPVGSCVGQKGVRIQNIINELNGEKIDVIEWNEEPSIYIASSLLPATVMAVDINDEEKFARVIVPDDQLSLAIGKSGQNARLAAKLTGWKIDIKSENQFRQMLQESQEAMEAEEAEEVESEPETEETEEIVEVEPELSVEALLATTKENQTLDDIEFSDGSETMNQINKFVDENPEAVAALLRNWLNDDWE